MTVDGDPEWGSLVVEDGVTCVSPVVDIGSIDYWRIQGLCNKYGTGTNTVTVSWRYSSTAFTAYAVSPDWAEYAGETIVSCRYVQWKVTYTEEH